MELSTITYDGRIFAPADNDVNNTDEVPTGRYFQDGDLVWAEFSGAHVRAGRLIGQRRADGTIDAAYCQVTAEGRVLAGRCVSTPSVLPDGRLRLTERWRRCDGTTGVSQIEEVPA